MNGKPNMEQLELAGYIPGALGWVTQLHGAYYAEHWGLGLYFEAKVASELAVFLSQFDPARDGAWIARLDGEFVGAVFIDGKASESEGARLRWFIVSPAHQGKGIGNRLMDTALTFCKQVGFKRIYLTTFAGLEAARHLYDKYGFRVCNEEDGSHLTGKATLIEQVLELFLSDSSNDL